MRYFTRALSATVAALAAARCFGLVEYYLAYGDQALVDLAHNVFLDGQERDPNAILGGRIPTDRRLWIPGVNFTFSVEVRMKVISSGDAPTLDFPSGVIYLGFDRDAAPALSEYADLEAFTAAQDDKFLTVGGLTIASSITNLAQNLPGKLGTSGTSGFVNMQAQGAAYLAPRYSKGSDQRSIGITLPYIFGLSNRAALPPGTDVGLCRVTLKNIGLAHLASYGTAGTEKGLCLYSAAEAVSRANFVVTTPKELGYPASFTTIAVQAGDYDSTINQPPKIDSPPDLNVPEESTSTVQFTATDDDVPKHQLTFTLPTPVEGASITPDGLFSYDAPEGTGGRIVSIRVRVYDYYQRFDETTLKVTVVKRNKHVRGTILLQDYLGNPSRQTATFLIYRVSDGALVTSRYGVPIRSNGSFDIAWASNEIPAGTYRVWCKATHWLSEVSDPIQITPTGYDNLGFSVRNGDVDGDNEVTVLDYSILSDAFDGRLDDASYLDSADLDGDGWITVFDYSILSLNFDQKGH